MKMSSLFTALMSGLWALPVATYANSPSQKNWVCVQINGRGLVVSAPKLKSPIPGRAVVRVNATKSCTTTVTELSDRIEFRCNKSGDEYSFAIRTINIDSKFEATGQFYRKGWAAPIQMGCETEKEAHI